MDGVGSQRPISRGKTPAWAQQATGSCRGILVEETRRSLAQQRRDPRREEPTIHHRVGQGMNAEGATRLKRVLVVKRRMGDHSTRVLGEKHMMAA